MDSLCKHNAESQNYGRVMIFGLSEAELEILHHSLLSKNTEVFDTDVATDLVAVAAEVIIIKADALDKEGRELLLDYYNEVADYSDEVVFTATLRSVYKAGYGFTREIYQCIVRNTI